MLQFVEVTVVSRLVAGRFVAVRALETVWKPRTAARGLATLVGPGRGFGLRLG